MDALDAIKSRVSVRKFESKPIPRPVLFRILDSARWAPSAGNLQSWEFVIVEDASIRKKVADACLKQQWIAEAPTVVVVCADTERSAFTYGERGKYFYSIVDTATAIENLLIAATSEGIGSCAVAGFEDNTLRLAIGLPEAIAPIAVIPLGYAAEKPSHPQRADLSDILHFDRYGNFNPKNIPSSIRAQQAPSPSGKQKKPMGLLGVFR